MSATGTGKKASGGVRERKSAATARLDARVSRRLKEKIEQAAHLRDQSVADFLTITLDEAASRVILEDAALQLHRSDQQRLAEVLLSDKPFPPIGKLSRLRRYASEYAKAVERR